MVDTVVRYVFFGVFAGIAAVMFRHGASLGNYCGLFEASGETGEARLERALERRQATERLPALRIARVVGTVAAACAGVSIFAPLPVIALSYALICVVWAVPLGFAVLRVRRGNGPRAAQLRARAPGAGMPPSALALSSAAVVMPLVFIDTYPAQALLVTAAGLFIGLIACGVATMPALLTGQDNEIEVAIDDRLRALRTAQLFAFAVVPGFVFISLSVPVTPLRAAACAVAFAAFLVNGELIRRRSRTQTLDPIGP
jgi:hypothetical protein